MAEQGTSWLRTTSPEEAKHLYETALDVLVARLASQHRGQEVTATAEPASEYRPGGEPTVTRWPGGSRHLAVRIDQVAVDTALERLNDRPLVESLIHGLLLLVDHPDHEVRVAPAPAVRPAAVRDALDIIEAEPAAALTTATLAKQCHISVRSLQERFQRHLGMSPMAYVREVRLRHAHRDLRSADPSRSTVASIAHRWGFTHVGRFAAVHKAKYGASPMQTLRTAY